MKLLSVRREDKFSTMVSNLMNKKKREYDRTIKIAVVFTFLYIEIISCFSLSKTKRAEIERVELGDW